MSEFKVGSTYSATSPCDHECVWTFKVVARTAKFLTLRNVRETATFRTGVKVSNGDEWALPLGRYSMAPVLRASRESNLMGAT